MKGELVYTGCLRTNIAAFVSKIPVRGEFARVSSELFAQTGDVHLILGNIRQEQYSVETADGRGKTKADAMGRLARVVCADTEALSEEDIIKMAQYIYGEQVNQIVEGLNQVRSQLRKFNGKVVVTGLGKEFLASKAARKAGFDRIIDLNNLIGVNVSQMSPAVAVAIMAAEKIGGAPIKWKQ
jgi:probable H4MPT-linked C1 transfer pathway protein